MLRFDETYKYELKEILNDALPKELETYLNDLNKLLFRNLSYVAVTRSEGQ